MAESKAKKITQELKSGAYGPYQLSWSKAAQVWLLTANSEREIAAFKIGSDVQNRKGIAKAFGTVDDIKRCNRFLKALDRRMRAAQSMILPELAGLSLGVTDDGMIRVRGEHTGLYLDLSQWEFPRGVCRKFGGDMYLPADHKCIPAFLAAMQGAEELVTAYLVRPLPARASELRWCRGERDGNGALIYRGRLILTDQEALPGATLAEALCVPGDQEEAWTNALLAREQELRAVLESDTFPAFRDGLDTKLTELNALDVKYGEISLSAERDGPWLVLSVPDGLVKPAWLRKTGWLYSTVEGAWVVNATRFTLDAVCEALDALTERVKPYSSIASYSDPLAELDGLFPAPEPTPAPPEEMAAPEPAAQEASCVPETAPKIEPKPVTIRDRASAGAALLRGLFRKMKLKV